MSGVGATRQHPFLCGVSVFPCLPFACPFLTLFTPSRFRSLPRRVPSLALRRVRDYFGGQPSAVTHGHRCRPPVLLLAGRIIAVMFVIVKSALTGFVRAGCSPRERTVRLQAVEDASIFVSVVLLV